MKKCRRILVIPALLLAACHGGGPLSSSPSSCADLGAAEAAFVSHMFAENHASIGDRAAALFVELPGGEDPSPEFLERIVDVPVRLGPAGEATVDDAGRIRDPLTGDPALLVRIIAARLTGPDQAEIRGGYEEAPLSASQARYELRCESGAWRVAGHGPLKIS
jgi:hypothetical protein